MESLQFVSRMRYGVLVILAFAMVTCVWAAALGVRMAVDSSVPGGIAVVVIAAILFAAIAWRVRFMWKRLHSAR